MSEHRRSQQPSGNPPTLLDQMGGPVGLVAAAVPVVVFVPANSLFGLTAGIIAALASAVLIAIWRLAKRSSIQPAISGLLGVAIAGFIAYRTGEAKDYFLLGIWLSVIYGGAFLISLLVRWPLVGLIWSMLNRSGQGWRRDPRRRRAYDLATLAWVIVFGARFVVQQWLYDAGETGWLGAARIGMGAPLAALAMVVTIWAISVDAKATKATEATTAHGEAGSADETGARSASGPAASD